MKYHLLKIKLSNSTKNFPSCTVNHLLKMMSIVFTNSVLMFKI